MVVNIYFVLFYLNMFQLSILPAFLIWKLTSSFVAYGNLQYKAARKRSAITEMASIEQMDRAESMIERP